MRQDGAGADRAWRSDEGADALLYGGSAAFAALTGTFSTLVTYRLWGQLAFLPYVVAALVSWRMRSRRLRPGSGAVAGRTRVALAVAVGVTLLPLIVEVTLRDQRGSIYAQSEALITEEAAAALVEGRNPYASEFVDGPLANRPPGVQSHFPYLPLMTVFGLPRAATEAPWADARVLFGLFSVAMTSLALARWRTSPARRLRAFQVLLVLPSGALFVAVGGDDLPVLALMLLAVVLAREGAAGWAGLAAGVAALMKFTAWPLMLLLPLAGAKDRQAGWGRWMPAAVSAAVVLIGLPLVLWRPGAFLEDAVLFPLGLSRLSSLARTPTVGSVALEALAAPGAVIAQKALLTGLLLGAALLLASPYLRPNQLTTAAGVARGAGAGLALVFLLAPVGRLGYCIYPINLLLWSKLLRDPAPDVPGDTTIGSWKPSGSFRSWPSSWSGSTSWCAPSSSSKQR